MEISTTPKSEGQIVHWQPYTEDNKPADKSKCLYMIFTEMEGIYDAADAHFIPNMSRVPNSHIAIFRELKDAECIAEESSGESAGTQDELAIQETSEEV